MHIGGAANGLQFVVYDPTTAIEADSALGPEASTPPVVPHDGGAAPQERDGAPSEFLYNPVTDLIGRLVIPAPGPAHPSASSTYDAAEQAAGSLDLRA